jgi:undecaprenyl-diphosphatase
VPLWQVIVLSIVQGLAELLPVSSSAHVVVAEKLMGLDPSAPRMTLLLVSLHTGTMIAVIVYFWRRWREEYFFRSWAMIFLASAITGIVGEILIKAIEKFTHAEAEDLFGRLDLIVPALAVAGILIIAAGIFDRRAAADVGWKQASLIGAVQALCLPFRGFSRSGATISTGMLARVSRERAGSFSFALAVILTPPAIAREVLRLARSQHGSLTPATLPCVIGAFCAFLAGLLALRWLSRWLEGGRWHLFGIYCLAAAAAVAVLHHFGY